LRQMITSIEEVRRDVPAPSLRRCRQVNLSKHSCCAIPGLVIIAHDCTQFRSVASPSVAALASGSQLKEFAVENHQELLEITDEERSLVIFACKQAVRRDNNRTTFKQFASGLRDVFLQDRASHTVDLIIKPVEAVLVSHNHSRTAQCRIKVNVQDSIDVAYVSKPFRGQSFQRVNDMVISSKRCFSRNPVLYIVEQISVVVFEQLVRDWQVSRALFHSIRDDRKSRIVGFLNLTILVYVSKRSHIRIRFKYAGTGQSRHVFDRNVL